MKKWKTKNGYEIFALTSGRSNAFLISKEGVNVLIDTGYQYAYHRLQNNIDHLNIAQKNIMLLILTHSHFDHCRNAFAIQQQEKCKILMSEKEAGFVKKGYTPIPAGTFQIARFISGIGSRIGKNGFGYQPFSPDILVNETFDWTHNDFTIQIISTNGHSSGSVSIIVDKEIALVGDAMLGTFPNSIFPPFADDIPGMIKSWDKLLATECKLFLPGHGTAVKRELLQREYYKYAEKYNITIRQ